MRENEIIRIGPVIADDGSRVAIRQSEDGVNVGKVRPMVDGQPLVADTEILHVSHRERDLYEITSSYKVGHTGPAMVSSNAFRNGWDQTFGSASIGQA